MTSPSIPSQPISQAADPVVTRRPAILTPLLLFAVTLLSTTAVGMRYMYNFRLGLGPLNNDEDILPYVWVSHHLAQFATGFPFSLTLIAILLAHEFGHYFACRSFGVRSTLPYMLPAPSISGSFGAIIRLKSRIPSRSALMVIAAMGPISGFVVAIAAVVLGLHLSGYLPVPVLHRVQAPLLIALLHLPVAQPLEHILPHPILSAAWIGILITSLNLIPAGQLDGGHMVYAISPALHRITSRVVTILLMVLGIFFWVGWILWALILLTPSMRHPKVPSEAPLKSWQFALLPVCMVILVLAFTYQPFQGYGLFTTLKKVPSRYHLSHASH